MLIKPKKNIEIIRKKKGIQVGELSEKSGIHRATIASIERKNVRSVNAKTAHSICNALEMDFDELFEFVNEKEDKQCT